MCVCVHKEITSRYCIGHRNYISAYTSTHAHLLCLAISSNNECFLDLVGVLDLDSNTIQRLYLLMRDASSIHPNWEEPSPIICKLHGAPHLLFCFHFIIEQKPTPHLLWFALGIPFAFLISFHVHTNTQCVRNCLLPLCNHMWIRYDKWYSGWTA